MGMTCETKAETMTTEKVNIGYLGTPASIFFNTKVAHQRALHFQLKAQVRHHTIISTHWLQHVENEGPEWVSLVRGFQGTSREFLPQEKDLRTGVSQAIAPCGSGTLWHRGSWGPERLKGGEQKIIKRQSDT